MLVGLGFFGLGWPSLCMIGHLDLQGYWWALGPVRAAGVLLLWGLQCRPDSFPPPLDQRHTVTDGLGHNFHVAFMEES